jgi:quercetin dioxygenase-like cupin family protein
MADSTTDSTPNPGLTVTDHHEMSAGYAAPSCEASGNTSTSYAVTVDGQMWVLRANLDEGSTLTWAEHHGDEVVYVLSGEIEVDGRSCTSETAIVVESDAPAVVTARSAAEIVHMGPVSPEPFGDGPLALPYPGQHHVHVINADDVPVNRFVHPDGTVGVSRWYADGVCRTCRLALVRNQSDDPASTPSHSHSQGEIMYLIRGDLKFGPTRVTPGSSVYIPGGRRYSFRSDNGFEFINYRRGLSTFVGRPDSDPTFETWNRREKAGLTGMLD